MENICTLDTKTEMIKIEKNDYVHLKRPNSNKVLTELSKIHNSYDQLDEMILDPEKYFLQIGKLSKVTAMQDIIAFVRKRLAKIDHKMEEQGINAHGELHAHRVFDESQKVMNMLGLSNRKRVLAGISAYMHDFGYYEKFANSEVYKKFVDNYVEKELAKPKYDGKRHKYIEEGSTKGSYKFHAPQGAIYVKKMLKWLFKNNMLNGYYVDEDSLVNQLDENDIEEIYNLILNHNSYGKEVGDGFNIEDLSLAEASLFFADKIDIWFGRICKKHVKDYQTIMDDDRPVHRKVPYCVLDYKVNVDQEKNKMSVKYFVSLKRLNLLGIQNDENFEYSKEDFLLDFDMAYEFNMKLLNDSGKYFLKNIKGNNDFEQKFEIDFEFVDDRTNGKIEFEGDEILYSVEGEEVLRKKVV